MSSKLAFTIRKYHKWLSLLIGLQVFLWLASGVYMVVVNLNFIHGDHLVQNMDDALPSDVSGLVSFVDIQSQFPQATEITLGTWLGTPHYQISGISGSHLVDASTGLTRSPLSKADAIAAAEYHYAGNGVVVNATLFGPQSAPPGEIQSRPLPLWQVAFDDFGGTTFYISPDQGHLVVRRHTFWRVFDFAWMLHIMDYENRADVNNNLFRVAAFAGLLTSLFGIGLLFYSFRRKKQNVQPGADGEHLT